MPEAQNGRTFCHDVQKVVVVAAAAAAAVVL